MSLGTTTTAARCTDLAGDPGVRSSAHTPGEWFYRICGDGFVIRSRGAQGPIAGINGSRPITDAEANARLIAAAPELLAALNDALEALDAHAINYEPTGSNGKTARQVVRAAIAKATGAEQ